MSKFKAGDLVRVINDEEIYLKAGELCKVLNIHDKWVSLESEEPSYCSGYWGTGLHNIELIEAFNIPLEEPETPAKLNELSTLSITFPSETDALEGLFNSEDGTVYNLKIERV